MTYGPKPKLLALRFWSKVDKNGPIPEHRPELGSCWLWTGNKKRARRAYMRLSNPRTVIPASRVAWFVETGKWPKNDCCHHCDNPECVRFSHLFDGSKSENMKDAVRKGRHYSYFRERSLAEKLSNRK